MHLYHTTVRQPTAISHAIHGNFSRGKHSELVVARDHVLELLRCEEGVLTSMTSVEVFGLIRSLVSVRLTGDKRDYIVVGTDSGRISILEYDDGQNQFVKVHEETFGRSGCRRLVPGQYLAADPKGRAVMIAAVEKQKLVYVLNHETQGKLTISSPLEAHKAHTLLFSVVGLDVGFENPVFACIEMSYHEADQDPTGQAARDTQKYLTFYELDLGVNTVVRKTTRAIDRTANLLVPLPGGADGPGGVLVCAKGAIYFYTQGKEEPVGVSVPLRSDMPEGNDLLIVSYATQRTKGGFFLLLQSELGDLYKVTMEHKGAVVSSIAVMYFDTVPVSLALCLLKSGHLFAACEHAPHALFSLSGLGDDLPVRCVSTANTVVHFQPRALTNLERVEDLDNYAPITQSLISDMGNEGSPQIYALCGSNSASALRVVRHGLSVNELAATSLPGRPNAIWAFKKPSETFHRHIVVSFSTGTLVLSIGETVEELPSTQTGFEGNAETLHVGSLIDDSVLQIFAAGMRQIKDVSRRIDWGAPQGNVIVCAASNERQAVIALQGGEIIYFELDGSQQMREVVRHETGSIITCLEISPLEANQLRAHLLAVGVRDPQGNHHVQVFSLEPQKEFTTVGQQVLQAAPTSLAITKSYGHGTDVSQPSMILNCGTENGVLHRTLIDNVTGQLSDTRQRFLGAKRVKLAKARLQEQETLLALTSRAYLCYNRGLEYEIAPITYETLDGVCAFSTPQCPKGLVGFCSSSMRILSLDQLDSVFNHVEMKVSYTPRRAAVHPESKLMVVIETEHNCGTEAERKQVAERAAALPTVVKDDSAMEVDTDAAQGTFGYPRMPGKWASIVRVVNPVELTSLAAVELEAGECAVSVCTVAFVAHSKELFVAVGVAKNLQLVPRSCAGGAVHLYRMAANGTSLTLEHKTPVEDVPGAMTQFQGRLLVGMGRVLRIYDLGKKKLLRKCENKTFPNAITQLHVQGDRIFVGDVQESFFYVRYRKTENQLVVFADNFTPRWLTAGCVLDQATMAGGDKFGNFFVSRLPPESNQLAESDPMSAQGMIDSGILNGAPYKADEIVRFHIGDVITGMAKTSMMVGSPEVLLYTTLHGSIGAFVPLGTRGDIDFLSNLEMHIRDKKPPLCGRDHMAWRGFYFPVKNTVDGDLCQMYARLDAADQQAIAKELDREPAEILRKLEDMKFVVM